MQSQDSPLLSRELDAEVCELAESTVGVCDSDDARGERFASGRAVVPFNEGARGPREG